MTIQSSSAGSSSSSSSSAQSMCLTGSGAGAATSATDEVGLGGAPEPNEVIEMSGDVGLQSWVPDARVAGAGTGGEVRVGLGEVARCTGRTVEMSSVAVSGERGREIGSGSSGCGSGGETGVGESTSGGTVATRTLAGALTASSTPISPMGPGAFMARGDEAAATVSATSRA